MSEGRCVGERWQPRSLSNHPYMKKTACAAEPGLLTNLTFSGAWDFIFRAG